MKFPEGEMGAEHIFANIPRTDTANILFDNEKSESYKATYRKSCTKTKCRQKQNLNQLTLFLAVQLHDNMWYTN